MRHKHSYTLALAILLVASGISSSACTVRAASSHAVARVELRHPAPPPLRSEVVVASPGRSYIWVGGHYVWRPGPKKYVWVAGKWTKPPRGKAVWVAPRYDRKRGVYIAGFWR